MLAGSDAEAVGVRAGDVLVSIDGAALIDLACESRWFEGGGSAELVFMRDGEGYVVRVGAFDVAPLSSEK